MRLKKSLAVFVFLIGTQSYAKRATLRWSPLKDASSYRVEISRNGIVRSTDSTMKTSLSKELPPGKYTFRVHALDKGGTPGQWTPEEAFTITLDPLKLRVKTLPDRSTLNWTSDKGASYYYVSLIKEGKVLIRQSVLATEFSSGTLESGNYVWTVQSAVRIDGEPDYIEPRVASLPFTLAPPVRKVATDFSPAPKSTIITPLPTPADPNFLVGLRGSIFPYRYYTQELETTPVDAQGILTDLYLRYQFSENTRIFSRAEIAFQKIGSKNYPNISIDIYLEYFQSLGINEKEKDLRWMAGVGIRYDEWFLIRPIGTDTLITLGPVLSLGLEKRFNQLTLFAGVVSSIPLFILSQNNFSERWQMDNLSFVLEPRGQLGYEITKGLELISGIYLRPRELKLKNSGGANYIVNRGIAGYLGCVISF